MKSTKIHKHTWVVSSMAIILGVILLVLLPHHKGYSLVVLGIAGGHLVFALMAIFAGWLLTPQKLIDKIWKKNLVKDYDFGWSYKWIYGFLLAAIIMLLLAIHSYISLAGSPNLQIVVYTILLLVAVNLFIANAIIQNTKRTTPITLPMVNLLANGGNQIIDAGCGAGRTTIAVAHALQNAHVTSFDKFDANYIDGGGRKLLEHNIKIAGIEDRVKIVSGDITQTPFESNQFDALISSFMFDHLRTGKKQALKETYRILKPGGRVLLIIIVRGYTAFGVASLMSLLITSRKTWKKWIEEDGFSIINEGTINEGAYFCFEKPKLN